LFFAAGNGVSNVPLNTAWRNAAVEDATAIMNVIQTWATAMGRSAEFDKGSTDAMFAVLDHLLAFVAVPTADVDNTDATTRVFAQNLTTANQSSLFVARNNAINAIFNAIANANLDLNTRASGVALTLTNIDEAALRMDGATQGTTQAPGVFTAAVFDARNLALANLLGNTDIRNQTAATNFSALAVLGTGLDQITLFVNESRGNLQSFSVNGATASNVLRGGTNSQNAVRDALRGNWDEMPAARREAAVLSTATQATPVNNFAMNLSSNARTLVTLQLGADSAGGMDALVAGDIWSTSTSARLTALTNALNAIRTNDTFTWVNGTPTAFTTAVALPATSNADADAVIALLVAIRAGVVNATTLGTGHSAPAANVAAVAANRTPAQYATAITQINALQAAIDALTPVNP
jgi:hypothetical protein